VKRSVTIISLSVLAVVIAFSALLATRHPVDATDARVAARQTRARAEGT